MSIPLSARSNPGKTEQFDIKAFALELRQELLDARKRLEVAEAAVKARQEKEDDPEVIEILDLEVEPGGGISESQCGQLIHLLDPATGVYNEPFLDASLRLLPGYGRLQGVVTRSDETRETEELLDDPALRVAGRL